MKQYFEIFLNFKVGQEFEDTSCLYKEEKVKYRIRNVFIVWNKNTDPVVNYEVDCLRSSIWMRSERMYNDKQLSKICKGTSYKFETELKYSFDDIIISGVNNIIPDQIDTFKNSCNFIGNILKINQIRIEIFKNNKLLITYATTDQLLYNGFNGIINPYYKKQSATTNESYGSLLSDLNINRLIDIKCKEFSKKIWRNAYNALYNNRLPIINDFKYENKYAGLFKFLMVEEKAIDIYYQYVNQREYGIKNVKIKNKKRKTVDKLIESLNNIEKQLLIDKLKN